MGGTFDVAAASQIDCDLILSSNAVTTFGGTGTLDVTGQTTIEDGADAVFNLDVTLPRLTLRDFGTNLSGSGTLAVSEQFDWNARANIVGTGSLDIQVDATMTINSGIDGDLKRRLNNFGTVVWQSGTIGGDSSTQFHNRASGTLRVEGNNRLGGTAGQGSLRTLDLGYLVGLAFLMLTQRVVGLICGRREFDKRKKGRYLQPLIENPKVRGGRYLASSIITAGATRINDRISVVRQDCTWTYFCGVDAIFQHPEHDTQSFRMFTSQLVCQDVCRQVDIVRAFGVSISGVKRNAKKFREKGTKGFYQPRKRRRGHVLTDVVLVQAQELLSSGASRREVADELGVLYDTIRKAINQGRLHEPDPDEAPIPLQAASDKSDRSLADASAEMSNACTRPEERVFAWPGRGSP